MLCILGLIAMVPAIGQDRLPRNNIGFSAGLVPAVNEIYIDDPFDTWPARQASYIVQLSYARHFTEACLFGPYLEFEKVRFTGFDSPELHSFQRFNAGINWLGKYPLTKLHMQLGGFVGFGFLRKADWDDLWGPDAGMIAGPAFETRHFGVALHFQIGYAWYESTGIPQGVMLYNPKFLLKFYGKL